ncbi:MAG: hypothetical protein F2663_06560 [Actinobacteria bacterium]|uniref:Unannotated protein n=1 Tax=freshwater metagenome TaxID=449393 RepID=A0A6J6PXV8_9ZZZZ|nr:hypothetical protein [Actinomycetota bacterium]
MERKRERAAAAGALAALAWAAAEPFDEVVLRTGYSDVALLGKSVTRSWLWWPIGMVAHAANGAAFGIGVAAVAGHSSLPVRKLAFRLAMVEHVLSFPFAGLADRKHPARGMKGVKPVFTFRGFVQATWRHALFGAVLGRLLEHAERRSRS